MSQILIVAGSKNDIGRLSEVEKIFRKNKIKYKIEVISAHRNIKDLVKKLEPKLLAKNKISVILAVAHSVSNLPAIIAGHLKDTPVSVVGVGLTKTDADTLESLFSVISIPKGIPLVNTGINEVGLYNAALYCLKLLEIWRITTDYSDKF